MVIRFRWWGLGLGLSFCTCFLAPVQAQTALYQPLPLALNQTLTDVLSPQDIPTGEGGFARDYQVQLQANDQIVIDLQSNEFDTVLVLIAADGSTVGANDDSPEGGSNSLLFARIQEAGRYIVRVRTFGLAGGGRFNLKVTRLRPMD
ncbi:PPC domain-containing protein [Synechocystis sp. LKSZ1]|uniref:PPC domain-containing protein n=1 Tax=Synechocystis sp. LKSZ1 TaxID=3144951 RepID=UPI00336BC646